MAENLREAADLAAQAGMCLCLETLSRKSVPDMLLQHMPDALAVLRAARHPAVRLIFDTLHVQIMLLYHLEQAWDAVEVVQLGDNPDRAEPGSGEINFESVLRLLFRRGYKGLVELEHGWAVPGLQSERRTGATTCARPRQCPIVVLSGCGAGRGRSIPGACPNA